MDFKPYMSDDIHPTRNLSTFQSPCAQCNVPPVDRETLHHAPFNSTYESNVGTIPLVSDESDVALAEQALPTSPFSASVGSRNLTTNPVRGHYFEPNATLAFPTYTNCSHGQYSDKREHEHWLWKLRQWISLLPIPCYTACRCIHSEPNVYVLLQKILLPFRMRKIFCAKGRHGATLQASWALRPMVYSSWVQQGFPQKG